MGPRFFGVLLAAIPGWRRLSGLQLSNGRSVQDEVAGASVVALQRCFATAAILAGCRPGAVAYFRLGLAAEVGYRAAEALQAALAVRRRSAAPVLMRAAIILYSIVVILIAVPAAMSYAEDPDVQRVAWLLISSGAALAAAVPLQYAAGPMSLAGSKVVFILQVAVLLVFVWCRFVVGVFPRPSPHGKVVSMLQATDPAGAVLFGIVIFVFSYVFSGVVALLVLQRARKARYATTKIKHLRAYFAKNDAVKDEKDVIAHIWASIKLADVLLSDPWDMLAARLRAGPLLNIRGLFGKKTA